MRRRRICRAIWCGAAVLGAMALSAPSASAAEPAAKVKPASGTPIPVTFVNLDATSSTAPARQGAKAAVKELNRTGGIGGRPIRLTECVTDQTPEKGKACMDAAATAKPAAVLAVQPGAAVDSLASLADRGHPVRRSDLQHQRHAVGPVLDLLLWFRLRRPLLVVGELPEVARHGEARRAAVHLGAGGDLRRQGVRGADLPARRHHAGGGADPGGHRRYHRRSGPACSKPTRHPTRRSD